ncbi:MAG: hypothetical protein FD122_3808, partial [Stygiobacter sp.]
RNLPFHELLLQYVTKQTSAYKRCTKSVTFPDNGLHTNFV